MSLEIVTIPCRTDNYAYLVHDEESGAVAVVDVPDAAPILKALAARNWTLTDIFITHHHQDHIDGVDRLKAETGARVIGAVADIHRLPALDQAVREGDRVRIGAVEGTVIDVSGHTIGHVAFHFPGAVFTADSLMALGCGRLFEGDPATMWASLQKLAALPPETQVYSGHEYTAANGAFAVTVDPANTALAERVADVARARAAGEPTVPALLSLELATNPFLRATSPEVKAQVGLAGAPDAEVFAEIRRRKDCF